jgi:glycosyltransferase involved in cell wall biosynthesis
LTSAPSVDVVIVTHRSAEHIESCVSSVPRGMRVVVVDNASDDGSADVAERLGCEVIRNEHNVGFARAVNRAVRERVTAECVLLLNPDARLGTFTVERLVEQLAAPDVAIAAPALRDARGQLQRPWWPFPSARGAWKEAFGLHRLRPDTFDETRDVDFVVGACFLIRTDVFRQVGGFDERYWLYGEESDLCRRVRDLGWRVRYVADATAFHEGGASGVGATDLVGEHFIRGSERFVLTHHGTASLVSFRLANVVGAALRLPALRPGDPRRAVRARNLRRGVRSLARHPRAVAPADRSVAQPSVVVCSLERWDEVWRRNQFLVRELTDRDPSLRVLFVEPAIDPLHDLRTGRRPRLAGTGRLRPVPDRPQVIRFQPVKPLPRAFGGWADASLARQIRRAAAQVEMVDPVLWINDLDLTAVALTANWPVVYDITDDWLLASVPRRVVRARRRRELALLDRADEVVVCSRGLENTKGTFRPVTTITNAVDVDRFRAPTTRPSAMPADPAAVYVGTLHEDRLDVRLVEESARRLPDVHFVFVGPDALRDESRERLVALDNVHLLGAKPYPAVAAYLQHATVMIVPHVVSSFTESLDPIKAYECLAIGRPTLATSVAGFRGLGEPVHIATAEEYADVLASLVADPPPPRPVGNLPTWEGQAARFATVLDAARHRHTEARRIRVVFVDHVARLSGGEIALARVLPALIASGVDAHVILGENGPLAARLAQAGATVEVLPMDPSLRDTRRTDVGLAATMRNAGRTARHVLKLRRRIRELRPDVVHTNSLKACIYGGLAARGARVPVVWHVRDRIADDYLPRRAVRLVRALARIVPQGIVTNSSATAATVPGHPTVIHDVLDATPVRRTGPIGVRTIAVVGRISPWKGQHVVIEAFAKAFPDGDRRLVVAGGSLFGEEDYERALHHRADELGVGDRVDFLGHVDDVDAVLAAADVLVHASTTPEPFGQVILEGLAAGLPVIASGAGGAAEIIRDGVDGVLKPPGDVDALCDAMRSIAANGELRERLAAARRARALDFTPDRAVPLYRQAWRSARDRR